MWVLISIMTWKGFNRFTNLNFKSHYRFVFRANRYDLHGLKLTTGLLGKKLVRVYKELSNVLATIGIGYTHTQLCIRMKCDSLCEHISGNNTHPPK